ncbi:MAG TPA: hypothetical protein VK211_03065 [Kamptonema sp.]|nr:hypothetical protein [Kamptonema sp.]
MHYKFVEEFKVSIEQLLPAYLVIFDLADTKRRNLYLGHSEVDKDIIEFDTLLKTHLQGIFKRVAGDKWVACIAEQQLNYLPNLISSYANEVPIIAGWECTAIAPNGTRIFIEEKSNVTLSRAVRCGYLWVKEIGEVLIKVNELDEKAWMLPVNSPTSLEQTIDFHPPKWQCIYASFPDNYNCPFCDGTEFDDQEGTDDSSSGTCKQCGAVVDYRYC